ncbi:hypothetical protein [Moraxella lacunata]|uniref:hypothetical protein n=1 Tax=Moraxella lacunata TaxID=477 RepID=UPI003EE2A8BC
MSTRKPFVVSLSNHNGFLPPFDKLRANGKPIIFSNHYRKNYGLPVMNINNQYQDYVWYF